MANAARTTSTEANGDQSTPHGRVLYAPELVERKLLFQILATWASGLEAKASWVASKASGLKAWGTGPSGNASDKCLGADSVNSTLAVWPEASTPMFHPGVASKADLWWAEAKWFTVPS
ncbi:MAG: hypothetical protein CL822_03860 [Crocinitomicaceae bacterium]|nr:hypothetical protein [Crocinitomicaceae bacterium]